MPTDIMRNEPTEATPQMMKKLDTLHSDAGDIKTTLNQISQKLTNVGSLLETSNSLLTDIKTNTTPNP